MLDWRRKFGARACRIFLACRRARRPIASMRELPHTHSCFVCGEANPLGLKLRFEAGNAVSDQVETRFGVREVSGELDAQKQAEVFGVRAVEPSPSEIETEPSAGDVPEVIISPQASIPAAVTQLLLFGMSPKGPPPRKAARRPSPAAALWDQLALFQN